MIVGRIDGTRYRALFFMCEEGENCKDILFVTGWTDTDVTVADVNRWNSERRFGTAYIDSENDPILQLVVNLKGGVSTANMEDTWDWWRVALTSFRDTVVKGE